MATTTDATRRDQSLIEGRYMRCPRCKDQHDILRYVPMGQADEFLTETNPIYKCPTCRWIFSPALTLAERLAAAIDLLKLYAPHVLTDEARMGTVTL